MGWDYDECVEYYYNNDFKSDDERFEEKCWDDLTDEDKEIVEREFDKTQEHEVALNDLRMLR